ncbi:hypothetical protein RND61_25900 [Streptomyces sp. TRM76323]|uniref:Uncharacterized protein n=1 Tax=Streptomyces tamarix TaxID=3078565 RepID=A0ABU3QS10_9ACTN|nr:hypothetical protein [Streptomyces tamarix]MDT9685472.1 hypothetical protein [Streptomyces tamarix]
MSARTPTPARAATAAAIAGGTGGGTGTGPGDGGADARLPWWAVVLPVAAFAALFLLLAGPGQARATDGEPAVGRFLEQVRHTVAD